MQRLRTIRHFVRVLATLFVVAQFAGVVPSPLASTQASNAGLAAHVHHHHADDADAISHSHDSKSAKYHVDPCCGLHAFFTGVLPSVIVVDPVDLPHQQVSIGLADVVVGIDPGRIDRPPRPFAVI
jgi:hypothetical protein